MTRCEGEKYSKLFAIDHLSDTIVKRKHLYTSLSTILTPSKGMTVIAVRISKGGETGVRCTGIISSNTEQDLPVLVI